MSTFKKEFNNISDELQEKLSKLKKLHGPVFRFKLLNGKQMNLPVPGAQGAFETKTVYNSVYELPCRDTIIDHGTGRSVSLAVIKGWDDQNNPVFFTGKHIKGADEGRFDLNEKDPNDLLWIDFLLLSNLLSENNKENPIVMLIDEKKVAREKVARLNDKKAAIVMAAGMDNEQVVNFAAAAGWDENEDPEVIKGRISDMVESSPELFKALVESGQLDYRAVLKKAVTKGLVTYSPEAGTLSWANGGNVFATLDKHSERTYLEQFAEWAVTHPNGDDVFKTMKSLVKRK